MKYLYFMRHAKSSWHNPRLPDIERPLNDRGKEDAPKMGNYLITKGIKPDLLLSSPAKRAITTATIMAETIKYPVQDIIQDNDLYAFTYDISDILEVILTYAKPSHTSILVFGHNPTLTRMANELGDYYFENIPTCGFFGLTFNIDSWDDIMHSKGKLVLYMFPKILNGTSAYVVYKKKE